MRDDPDHAPGAPDRPDVPTAPDQLLDVLAAAALEAAVDALAVALGSGPDPRPGSHADSPDSHADWATHVLGDPPECRLAQEVPEGHLVVNLNQTPSPYTVLDVEAGVTKVPLLDWTLISGSGVRAYGTLPSKAPATATYWCDSLPTSADYLPVLEAHLRAHLSADFIQRAVTYRHAGRVLAATAAMSAALTELRHAARSFRHQQLAAHAAALPDQQARTLAAHLLTFGFPGGSRDLAATVDAATAAAATRSSAPAPAPFGQHPPDQRPFDAYPARAAPERPRTGETAGQPY